MIPDSLISHPLVGFLALVGAVGVAYRLGRSLLGLGIAWAEGAALNGLVEVSLRRGDLTALAERRVHADAIRRSKLRSGAALLLWAGVLVVPAVAGFARVAYAAAAVVWLLPRRPLRLTQLARPQRHQSIDPPFDGENSHLST